VIAITAGVALAALYVFALRTGLGRALDDAAMPAGLSGPAWGRAKEALTAAVEVINIASLALVGTVVLGVALARCGRRHALRVAVCLGGANLATHVLKPMLGGADPFGGDRLRVLHHSFPSGHATVAMSVAYALLAVVPGRWRGPCAALTAAYAAAVGVGLVMSHAHYASDVIGGYLVATAWAAGGVLLTRERAGRAPAPGWLGAGRPWPRPLRTPVAASLGWGALGVVAGWSALNASNLLLDARVHAVFLAAAAGIMAAALALPRLMGPLLHGSAERPGISAGT